MLLSAANRKAEEEQMWAHRERLQQQSGAAPMSRDRGVDGHSQRSPYSTDLSHSDSSGGGVAHVREDASDRGDDDIADMLARKRPR